MADDIPQLDSDDSDTGLEGYSINALKYEIKRRERIAKKKKEAKKRQEESKKMSLERTRQAIKDQSKRLEEVETAINDKEKKIEEGLKPIKVGDEVVLNDVVEEILSSYTPAVKKAIYKYRNKNIQKYNDYSREYNRKRMKDPAYKEHKRMMNARSNERAKLKRLKEKETLEKEKLDNIIIETNNGL